MATQELFLECYRGRQGFLHHCSYMRVGKVLMAHAVLRRAGISLRGKRIFDYGFGPGTLLRSCPADSDLSGVEIDSENVAAVVAMLRRRGFAAVNLQQIEIPRWQDHPLLRKEFDVVFCSHVLEHLPDPTLFLRRIRLCLREGGAFVGLVPINERSPDPKHEHRVDAALVQKWATEAELILDTYLEGDPWNYWIQPLLTCSEGPRHKIAQAVHLPFGALSTLVGLSGWQALSRVFSMCTASRPTQAGFVLRVPR